MAFSLNKTWRELYLQKLIVLISSLLPFSLSHCIYSIQAGNIFIIKRHGPIRVLNPRAAKFKRDTERKKAPSDVDALPERERMIQKSKWERRRRWDEMKKKGFHWERRTARRNDIFASLSNYVHAASGESYMYNAPQQLFVRCVRINLSSRPETNILMTVGLLFINIIRLSALDLLRRRR